LQRGVESVRCSRRNHVAMRKSESRPALHALARVAHDEHVQTTKANAPGKTPALLVTMERASLTRPGPDDHDEVDGEYAKASVRAALRPYCSRTSSTSPCGSRANAQRPKGRSTAPDGEQHDPAHAVSEGRSSDGCSEHRSRIKIGAGHHARTKAYRRRCFSGAEALKRRNERRACRCVGP